MTDAHAVQLMGSWAMAFTALMAECAAKATVLLAIAGLAVCLTRRQSAAWRHAVWLSAIVAILLLPVAVPLLPGWHALPAWPRAPLRCDSRVGARVPRDDSERNAHQLASLPGGASLVQPSSPGPAHARTATTDTFKGIPRLSGADASDESTAWRLAHGSGSSTGNRVAQPQLASMGLVAVWSIGVLWCAGRLGTSALRLHRLQCHSRSLSQGPLWDMQESVRRQLRVRGPVQLLIGPSDTSPMVWGIRRPRILLPTDAEQWGAQRQSAVITHEMSHICRRDALTQYLLYLTEMAYWFHPAVWLAAARIRSEREQACDDVVVQSGMRPTDYAEHLLRIAAGRGWPGLVGLTGLTMSRSGRLEARVRALLNHNTNRRSAQRGTWMAATALLVCLALPLVMLRAALPQDARPAIAEPRTPAGEATAPVRVGYVDGTAEGRRSIAGSGHAVQFECPRQARYLMAVEIFASRYGSADPPAEDFHLYLLDENHQLVQAIPFPYGMIERGEEQWYTLKVPAVQVPKRFLLALSFNPHQSKGIYLGLDASVERSHSFTGRPTQGYRSVAQTYDWMIRAVLVPQVNVTSPFDVPAID